MTQPLHAAPAGHDPARRPVARGLCGGPRGEKAHDAFELGRPLGRAMTYLALFIGLGSLIHPNATAETLLIRGLGTAALLLQHVILCL